ncbi:MAG TPA: long-chain fatty acid--CoA ligase [Kineosporiaceae bacterium]|nr:long-chain fatty acid--CoA ligase [Kineosporiaceae bacterium]
MNLPAEFVRSATTHAQRVALRTADGRTFTYGELDELTARVAGLVTDAGIEPGDRVGVMLPNIPEFAVAYYGVLRAGGVVVPMNPLLRAREVAHYVDDSGAKAVFTSPFSLDEVKAGVPATCTVTLVDAGFADLLAGAAPRRDLAARDLGDTAVILYTSGTTGRPKGAELSHGNLLSNAEVSGSDLLQVTPDDVLFGGLPLFHCFGQTCGLNAALLTGASVSLLARFDARTALDLARDHGVTIFEGVPTMYTALAGLDDIGELPRLRVAVSGGAALPVEVLRRFESRFDCMLLEGYGLSETSPVASFNHPDRPRKEGSIGQPIRGVEMTVIDDEGQPVPIGEVGEIAIRGDNVMKGYWNAPEATAAVLSADGWFRTGDLARQDEDGYFFIVDRKKDLIIRGGYNVYPREIEEVLYEHPAVAEAAVIGIPHPTHGEEVGAFVVLRPGAQVAADDLRSFVRERVAAYKYPREVWLVDALPKGPTGKILKREIVAPTES